VAFLWFWRRDISIKIHLFTYLFTYLSHGLSQEAVSRTSLRLYLSVRAPPRQSLMRQFELSETIGSGVILKSYGER